MTARTGPQTLSCQALSRRAALLAAAAGSVLALSPRPGAAQGLAQGAAQQAPGAALASATRANAATVGVISGGIDGTYARIAADLMNVLDDGDRLRVLAILGKGSVQNVSDVMFLRGVDIGIVQSDVLAYLRRERSVPGIDRGLQYIAKLYDEEVHILARRDIASLQDLAGKTVNVDGRSSGTAMTASVLFQGLGIAVQPAYDDQTTALEKLRRGEIAALVYVAGKPVRLFSGLSGGEAGLHLLPIPLTPALLETYLPAQLGHADYPALVPDSGPPVDTVAVGAVLAVFAWQPGSDRYARVERFIRAFKEKFPQLQQPPRHPKWRDVNLAAQVPGWTRFPAAQALLAGPTQPAGVATADRPAALAPTSPVPR
jgi:uncharacterized protein